MGMFTELFLTCDIKKDAEERVIRWLKAQVDDREIEVIRNLCPEELIGTNFEFGLLGGSYYFYGQPFLVFEYDHISQTYHLTLLTNIKNYSDEIRLFLDVISINLSAYDGEFIGYERYEENAVPDLLIYNNDRIDTVSCVLNNRVAYDQE
jgi:hypothetical protein